MAGRAKSVAERRLPPALVGAARSALKEVRQRRYRKRVVEHRYGGHPLRVEIRSPYGETYDRDWPLLGEIAFLGEHALRPGARVFDLGANHGVIAMMLARAVTDSGQVVAVEADAWLAEAVAENARLNDLDQVVSLHAAVGAEEGDLRFGAHGDVDDGTGKLGRSRVPAVTIDSMAGRYGQPDVVFMDVEGYELEALRGAQETLTRRPDWFVEVHGGDAGLARYGASVRDVVDQFRNLGYDCHVAADQLVVNPADDSLVSLTRFGALEDVKGELPEARFFLIALGSGSR